MNWILASFFAKKGIFSDHTKFEWHEWKLSIKCLLLLVKKKIEAKKEKQLLTQYPYNQGFLPSSKRNLLPTHSKIKAKHMPYTQGYFIIQHTKKKPLKFSIFFFHFIIVVAVVVNEAVVVVCFVYAHFDRHLLEGIEYFFEPIKTLHLTSVCIVYLRLFFDQYISRLVDIVVKCANNRHMHKI